MLHDRSTVIQQLTMAILFGFQRGAVKKISGQHLAGFGQTKALATFPGAQDNRFDQAFRAVATIKELLPCLQ